MEFKNTKITLVGTGRLAYSLAGQLIKSRFNIVSVISRTEKSAEEFAGRFNIKSFSRFTGEIPEESSVVFLTVSDQAITAVSKKIASVNRNLKGKVFIHFSGAHSSRELESIKKKKGLTGSFHILQTFPSKEIINIRDCYAAVESPDEGLLFSLFNFARQIKLKPFKITPENKLFYHMSGVFSSNFLISHFYNSDQIFKESKIENLTYLKLFGSIIDETIRNIKIKGLKESISGPLIRGDLVTIKKHISLLKKTKKQLLLVNYLTESLSILEILTAKVPVSKEFMLLHKFLVKELKASSKLI